MVKPSYPYVYMEKLETPKDTCAQSYQMRNTAMARLSMGKRE